MIQLLKIVSISPLQASLFTLLTNDHFLLSSLPPSFLLLLLCSSSLSLALVKKVKIKKQEYTLKIIDTAGQDEYSIFPPQYTMDIDGFCLVYRYC